MFWHPSESDLALVRSGDLSGWKRRLVERHLGRCSVCCQRADSYVRLSSDLRSLAEGLAEPAWLAPRIAATAPGLDLVPAEGVRWRLAPASALALLVLLALLLLGQQAPLPQRPDYQASATPEAVVGERTGPQGRQRVVLYTGKQRGAVEVSTGSGAIGVSHADPATGAVIITRISLGE